PSTEAKGITLSLFCLVRLLIISLLIPSGIYASCSEKLRLSKGRAAIEKFPGEGDIDILFLESKNKIIDNKARDDINPIFAHFFSRKDFFLISILFDFSFSHLSISDL
ncbi:unnamed protein product, partial [marine sediment metagenome]